ncbi:MAG: nuclear transport factor 2 family protein [Bacteroidota bacterium]|nr:nuclear transport factor 2 family protein [Bacteroidota bacterium]
MLKHFFTIKQITIYLLLVFLIPNISCKKNINKEKLKSELNTFMDTWHEAAANANEDIFFSMMDEDGIYLGTDQNEIWTRDELKEWSEQYFAKDTAWAFTPLKRNWYFSRNANIVWFDELLETQMGTCRGSGVIKNIEGSWKIKHYNLCLTIPNELMDDVIKLSLKK